MDTNQALLIFPHQLFEAHPGFEIDHDLVVLIEDPLFFGDRHHPAAFHLQKLWLHRTSMKRYAEHLEQRGIPVEYVEHDGDRDVLGETMNALAGRGITTLILSSPHDHLLERRLHRHGEETGIELHMLDTPMFLNTPQDNQSYRSSKKRWFMADFYKHQRRRLDVLMDGDDPVGERWSFDDDNRKKVPKAMLEDLRARGGSPPG